MYTTIYNPRIKMPSRRKLSSELIPEFRKERIEKFVTPKIAQMDTVSIKFDLWMSRGCEDIFDLILHGIDKIFKKHQLHLRMPECGSTRGVDLVGVLKHELEKHGLFQKLLACLKDGGSNLRTCTGVLRTVTDCRPMDIENCFEGICFPILLRVHAAVTSESTLNLNTVTSQATKQWPNCRHASGG